MNGSHQALEAGQTTGIQRFPAFHDFITWAIYQKLALTGNDEYFVGA
jgi:hypothetical protein